MKVRLATKDDAEALFALNEMFGNENELETLRDSLISNDREIICIAYARIRRLGS